MNIRKSVLLNNLSVGLVPILLAFVLFLTVNNIQVKKRIDTDMKQITATFKVALNNEMQKYMNYADMMFYNLYTPREDGSVTIGGNFPYRTSFFNVMGLVRYFIAYTDMKTFECFVSNRVMIREIYSWEENRYVTSEAMADYIWKKMIDPMNKPGFKTVFPEVVSNILVLRNCSLAVQPYTQARIGFNCISVPIDQDFLLNFAFRSPWFHYVVETEGGYVFDQNDFDTEAVVSELNKYDGTNSGVHLINLGELGRYYYYRDNLYRVMEKTNNRFIQRDVAYIGVLYDFEAYNQQMLLYQKLTVGIFVFIIALVLLISIVFYRRITEPILDLKGRVELFEQYHELIPSQLNRNDEISELANSFRHMSETIVQESEELERSKYEAENALNLLDSVADKMNATLDTKEIANLLIGESRKYIQFDSATVLLYNEKKKVLEAIAGYGDLNLAGIKFKPGEGIAGIVYRSGKPEFCTDTSKDPRFVASFSNPKSLMSVPIKSKERTIGVFNMDSDGTVRFTEDKLKWFNILISLAGVAMENATLYGNLERKVRERTKELAGANKTLARQAVELEDERNKLKVQNEIISEELELAKRIQLQFIPNRSPARNIAYYYRSMEQVGGDFFDFIRLPDGGIGIFISDVSGHGVPAAFVTSIIKSFSSQAQELVGDPAAYLYELNQFLIRFTAGNFVTAFYGIYYPDQRRLVYCNAGHNSPLHVDSKGNVREIDQYGNIALAIFDNDELKARNKLYKNKYHEMDERSKLVFYTDGMTEAVNIVRKMDEKYRITHIPSFEESLLYEVLSQYRHVPPEEYVEKIVEKLTEFRGSEDFDDDVCIICLDI